MFKKTALITIAIIPGLLLTACGDDAKTSTSTTQNTPAASSTPSQAPVFTPVTPTEAKTAYLAALTASSNKTASEGMLAESADTIVAVNQNYIKTHPNENSAAYFKKSDNTYHLIWEGEGLVVWYLKAVADANMDGITVEQTSPDTYIVHNPQYDDMLSSYPASTITVKIKDSVIVAYAYEGETESVITYDTVKSEEFLAAANKANPKNY